MLQPIIQIAPSIATSLTGQQSISSLASPSPQHTAPPSIFAKTQGRSHFAPPSDGPAQARGFSPESQAAALTSEEQEEAQRLGFGEGLLTAPGRRLLQAHVLQQEICSTKVMLIFTLEQLEWRLAPQVITRFHEDFYFVTYTTHHYLGQ